MKKLPIGEQSFEELISTGCVYVDKTQHVYNLINANKYYFLSRPRRFGKSLLCSTFEALFKNKRELFKNTWIDTSDYDWQEYPVIHFSMARCNLKSPESLEQSLILELKRLARYYKIDVEPSNNPKDLLIDFIEKLSKHGQVVVIIDEYDKPIVEHLTNEPLAQQMRDALRGFYGPFKDLGRYMKFLFITGVSKFFRTSLFSDMNHLLDLTMHQHAATLCGYTQRDIERYFVEHIAHVAAKMTKPVDAIKERMKEMYNGYRFYQNQSELVYNPFSVINFLSSGEFNNYWFRSGQTKFLFDLIKTRSYSVPKISNIILAEADFDKFDVDDIPLPPILYQTGYLTLAPLDPDRPGLYPLCYPNQEVRLSFEGGLLGYLTGILEGESRDVMRMLAIALKSHDLDRFFHELRAFLASIPYHLRTSNEEVHYQGIFYLICRAMNAAITVEEPTNIGRIDAVVRCPDRIYIFEFKINRSKEEVLKQIEDKKYGEKFIAENKPVFLVGVNFMIEDRNIDPQYLVKEYKPLY